MAKKRDETDYLNASKLNRERLEQAIAQIADAERQKSISANLAELLAEVQSSLTKAIVMTDEAIAVVEQSRKVLRGSKGKSYKMRKGLAVAILQSCYRKGDYGGADRLRALIEKVQRRTDIDDHDKAIRLAALKEVEAEFEAAEKLLNAGDQQLAEGNTSSKSVPEIGEEVLSDEQKLESGKYD